MPDRSPRNESSLRLFLTPLLHAADRVSAYQRDLAQVERDLAGLVELRDAEGSTAERDVFAPQVDLGIRIDEVIRDWLREQIHAAAADDATGSP